MFTVKVRDSVALGEEERLYSAEEIKVIRPNRGLAAGSAKAAQPNWHEAGIYLDPEPPQRVPIMGEEDRTAEITFAKTVILFGGDETDQAQKRKGGMVWVMNEHGATVATYDL